MPLNPKDSMKEVSGALGDIGTLLPLSLGAIGVAGLAPVPVLLGFAVFYIATGLYYRLPIPVQPMKAVAALLLTTEVTSQSLVASGVLAAGDVHAGVPSTGAYDHQCHRTDRLGGWGLLR